MFLKKTNQTDMKSIVRIITIAIFSFMILSCLICFCGLDFFSLNFQDRWLSWLTIVILIPSFYYIAKTDNHKFFIFGGFLLANAIMGAILLSFNTMPVSDYWMLHEMGKKMAAGNFNIHDYPENYYGNVFNWQIGIVWLQSIIFKTAWTSFTILKVINLIIINLTIFVTYLLCKNISDKRSASAIFLLMCVFYPVLVTVGQFSNQNVEALLLLLFIYLVNKKHFILAGSLLPIISFIRPVGIVCVGAFLIWQLLIFFTKQIDLKKAIFSTLKFIIPFLLISISIDTLCRKADYVTKSVSSPTLPYYKFHVGISYDGQNLYRAIEKLSDDNIGIDELNEWQKNEVKEAYTSNLFNTLGNNVIKMIMFTGYFDWKYTNVYNHVEPNLDNKIVNKCVAIGWGEYLLLLILATLGISMYQKKNGLNYLTILFICFIGAYFFIEAWPDYRYDLYFLMFIYASCGVNYFKNLIISLKQKAIKLLPVKNHD